MSKGWNSAHVFTLTWAEFEHIYAAQVDFDEKKFEAEKAAYERAKGKR